MTTLLRDWKAAKDKFEADSAKIGKKTKKPAEKAVFGLWRKSSGLEPCFKKLDALAESEPLGGGGAPEAFVAIDDKITVLSAAIVVGTIQEYKKWEGEVSKAMEKLRAAAIAYQALLKSSERAVEYQDLIPLLHGLCKKIDNLVAAADDYGTAATVTSKQLQELKSSLGDLCRVNTLGTKTVSELNKTLEKVPKNFPGANRRPEALEWPVDKKTFLTHQATFRKWFEASEALQAIEKKNVLFP